METQLTLLPVPRSVTLTGGTRTLPYNGLIVLDVPRAADLLFTAQRAQKALLDFARVDWEITGSNRLPATLSIALDSSIQHAQGYRLTVDSERIAVRGRDSAGLFYGVLTLCQLLQTQGSQLPLLVIEDWPDFAARGVMLDISRDKVPSMETLYRLIDMLASWKVNQLQLYMEHTFAYYYHRIVWQDASPMTAEEILALDAYCRERFVELVPNQNSFGHMHRWFEHARYLPLAETETGVQTPWGTMFEHPFSLSPAVPETLNLIDELFAELLPNFTSKQFNVGCDETFDLGVGRSKKLVEQKGKGRVYLDFLLEIYKRVKAHGRTMQFWGDIINQYPDLVPELPKDAIALEWGYDADHDFPNKAKLFAQSGIPFYVCPGTSSWTTIAGRTDNCMGNIGNAVENGLKNGAMGVLNTDWGDMGHWQPLPISYLGFAYGAALSWAFERNKSIDLPAALDAYAFHDKGQRIGKVAYDLGNAYKQPGVLIPNGSLLFWLYHRESAAQLVDDGKLRAGLNATLKYVDDLMGNLESAQMTCPDADLIKREFANAARMVKHGAKRGLMHLGDKAVDKQAMLTEMDSIIREYRQIWLARNRSGGLSDSVARLDTARRLYVE